MDISDKSSILAINVQCTHTKFFAILAIKFTFFLSNSWLSTSQIKHLAFWFSTTLLCVKKSNNPDQCHKKTLVKFSDPLLSQFIKCFHNDTKDNVQTDGRDNYEETYIKQQTPSSKVEWRTTTFICHNIQRKDLRIKWLHMHFFIQTKTKSTYKS